MEGTAPPRQQLENVLVQRRAELQGVMEQQVTLEERRHYLEGQIAGLMGSLDGWNWGYAHGQLAAEKAKLEAEEIPGEDI
jgi:hypothetical protein